MPNHHGRRDEERREERDEERREERREHYDGGSPRHGSPKHGHSGHHVTEGNGGYGAPSAGQYGAPSAGQYGAPFAGQYGAPSAGQYGGGYGGPPQNDGNFQNAVHAEAQRMEQERLANLQKLHHDQQVDLRNERIGEVGALAAGAFAMYEGYQAKKDPAHAKQHMLEAEIAGAAAVAAGGFAVYEHHQQTVTETKVHQLDGTPEKKHGWF